MRPEFAMRFSMQSKYYLGWLLGVLLALAGCGKERPAVEAPAHFTPKPTNPPLSFQDSRNQPAVKTTGGPNLPSRSDPSKTVESGRTHVSSPADQPKAPEKGRANLSSKSIHSKAVESGR